MIKYFSGFQQRPVLLHLVTMDYNSNSVNIFYLTAFINQSQWDNSIQWSWHTQILRGLATSKQLCR